MTDIVPPVDGGERPLNDGTGSRPVRPTTRSSRDVDGYRDGRAEQSNSRHRRVWYGERRDEAVKFSDQVGLDVVGQAPRPGAADGTRRVSPLVTATLRTLGVEQFGPSAGVP
jgi:hypothetical protein